jgi:glycosyltransferase involved in cell wall biosynthesis
MVNLQSTGTAPLVSIIIPCRNEAGYIERCLDSILASDYPTARLDILVADGRSTDGTREILERYCAEHPSVRMLDNPQGTTPTGLNVAIRASSGTIVIRMDAHVIYPRDYVRLLVDGLYATGADNVGGVLETLPAEDTPVGRAIALGMSHPFGVGNSHFRVGVAERRDVDTVPFGCFRREVFDRVGLFDEELIRNQDDEFNFRIISRGGRVLLLPEVSCRYYARRSIGHLARMYYQYGYFKPLVARKIGRVMTVRQLVPALLVTSLFGLSFLGLFSSWARAGLVGIVGAYALLAVLCAVPTAQRQGIRCGLALALVFAVLHLSYGTGFIVGIRDHLLVRSAPPSGAFGLSR